MSSRMAILRAIEARKTEMEVAQSLNDGEESQSEHDHSRDLVHGDASDKVEDVSSAPAEPRKGTRSSPRTKRSLPAQKDDEKADETNDAAADAKPPAEQDSKPAAKKTKVVRKVAKEGEGDPSKNMRIYREDIDMSTDVILCSTWGGGDKGVYTEVIHEWWERYEEAAHNKKQAVCLQVADAMYERGTRFLLKVDNKDGEDYYLALGKGEEKVKKRVLRALRKEVIDRTKHLTQEQQYARNKMIIAKRRAMKKAEKAGKALPAAPKAPPSFAAATTTKSMIKIPKGTVFSTTPDGSIIVTTKHGIVEVGGKNNTIKTIPNKNVEESAAVLAQASLPVGGIPAEPVPLPQAASPPHGDEEQVKAPAMLSPPTESAEV